MNGRSIRWQGWSLLAATLLTASACSGGATPTPAPTATPKATASSAPTPAPTQAATATPAVTPTPAATEKGLLLPNIDLSKVGGAGEGELNIIIWIGYAEAGAEATPEYNWVTAFQDQTGCTVKTKVDDDSSVMVTDMRTGAYDGVSASGDATIRLITNGDVAEVDTSMFPNFADVADFLKNAPHYVVNGKHYGVPHGWGGNELMYNTDVVKTAPTSWNVVFDATAAAPYKDHVTNYNFAIYIADAALYLKAHNPALGITDPYELTQPQLDAAVDLLMAQNAWRGPNWNTYGDEIDNFTNGTSVVGTAWPYQVNTLQAGGVPVKAVVPSEGMTGWADTWMLSTKAKHPNCMLKWMAWMLTPEVQTQVAEFFGEAPANPKACQYLDKVYGSYGLADFCTKYGVNDPSFYNSIAFWRTPIVSCGDARGDTCIDYDTWTTKWQEILQAKPS